MKVIPRVGVKLDGDDERTFSCRREEIDRGDGLLEPCNGHSDFCSLNFANFTFAGTHNAGTGQSDYPILHCAAKNQVVLILPIDIGHGSFMGPDPFQDLDVSDQLDFGIRFFDFDIIYSTSAPFCSGLETGHGKYPGVGIYQVKES